jgi:uncharacterized YigZ family protein
MFKVPLNISEGSLSTKKSEFISFVYPFSRVEEIHSFLKESKSRFREATHHVYAFRVGEPTHYQEGFSDDGEPSGTAGRPILSLLQSKGLSNLLVIVVRYYGGTPLGAGGLVRAYSGVAKVALEAARWEVFVPKVLINVSFPFSLYNLIRRELSLFDALLKQEEFKDKVLFKLELPKGKLPFMLERWTHLTQGECHKTGESTYELR